MIERIESSGTPIGRYLAKFYQSGQGGTYMWDELAAAAWIDPSVITKSESRYMSVNLERGAGYGDTLTWSESEKPKITVQPVEVEVNLDLHKFNEMFVRLMSSPSQK